MSDHAAPAFISIDAGKVIASMTHSVRGIRHNDEDIGKFRFYVNLIETEGYTCLWSGEDYEQAIREAERTRVEWDIDEPVHDNVAGGGR